MFKHALTHEVAYTTLPRYERGSLHRRVAQWLADAVPERYAETTELIAFHFDQAIHWGEDDEELRQSAFQAALTAGDAATRRGAYSSAERLLERALELATGPDERSRALVDAAQVDIHSSHYERALARLTEVTTIADEVGDTRLRADALGLRARAAWLRGYWAEALEAAEAAVATLEGGAESPELARALARLSQVEMLRALPTAGATSQRALEVARRVGEPAAEVNARINLFTTEAHRRLPSFDDISEVIDLAVERRRSGRSRAGRRQLPVVGRAPGPDRAGGGGRLTGTGRNWSRASRPRGTANTSSSPSRCSSTYPPVAGRRRTPCSRHGEVDPRDEPPRLALARDGSGAAPGRPRASSTGYLPGFRESALATDEPQRILPDDRRRDAASGGRERRGGSTASRRDRRRPEHGVHLGGHASDRARARGAR